MWFLTNANWSHALNLTKAMRGVDTSSYRSLLSNILVLELRRDMGHANQKETMCSCSLHVLVCVQMQVYLNISYT